MKAVLENVNCEPGYSKIHIGLPVSDNCWIRLGFSGILRMMVAIALSELLGVRVVDPGGKSQGRVREVVACPSADPVRVCGFIIKTSQGDCMLSPEHIAELASTVVRANVPAAEWPAFTNPEGLLLLGRDLLDQQIIDVHGRKVVRVNDLDLQQEQINHRVSLKIGDVDVGARGAVRRLLKGIVPAGALHALTQKLPLRIIPWEFVDLIETDPARRIKLKIEHERLARLHPADIADIVEELAPAEREAVFETLDEGVAAEALEEVTPKLQRAIVESLDSDRAADIVEEMDPDAAADLLADLPKEHTEKILEEMQPEERKEVSELLEFKEDTAAGRMTTDYLALPPTATVNDAIEVLRKFEGGIESVSTIFLVDKDSKLVGAVPLAGLVLAPSDAPLSSLAPGPPIFCHAGASEKEVAEQFDKYNLLMLPVVDDQGVLTGVITADDVISLLRSKL